MHPVEGIRVSSWLWTGWIRCNCDATGSKWTSNNYITRCHRRFGWVGVSLIGVWVAVRGSENQLPAEGLGPQDPRLSSPAEWERSAAIVRGTWGQYVAVCSVSNSPLTHNPFVNKVWEVHFSKELCSFVHYCWLCFSMYMYMYSCIMAIQQDFIT